MLENAFMEFTDIESFVLQREAMLRLGCFAAIFVAMFIWELLAPKRPLSVSKGQRWTHNLSLLILNSLVLRVLFPAAAVGIAYSTTTAGWGLFNHIALPYWLEVIAAVLLLDLAIYLQHVMMHRVPLLWRLHRVHHADLDIDMTTGSRFHTIEILVSMLIKWAVIMLLGPALLAVLIFETDSNYGFNLSIWDRLFRTYIDQPQHGHRGMTIGLAEFRDVRQVDRLPGMLALPFVKP